MIADCFDPLNVNPPLHDALVGANDGGLDVDGMVPHAPQLHGLLQSSHHEQSIMPLCFGKRRDKDRGRVGEAGGGGELRKRSQDRRLTSVGVGELGAAEEAQVARPGPNRLSVPKAESGVEVVGLEDLLAVTAVVTAAVVSAVHPDLQERVRMTDCRQRKPPHAICFKRDEGRERTDMFAALNSLMFLNVEFEAVQSNPRGANGPFFKLLRLKSIRSDK